MPSSFQEMESHHEPTIKAFHFHPHLSSCGISECTPTQHLDASLHLLESNKLQSIHTVETSLALKENDPFRRDINGREVCFLPRPCNKDITDNVVGQSMANTEDHARQQEEKLDVSYLKNAEVDNAIELSVVASEAVVIHDLLKSDLDSEALPVEAVLGVSLQVKNARNELLESSFHSLNEEVDLIDPLLDLDDLMMKDAFDDVGLSGSFLSNDERICETTTFDVQDTIVTDNHSPLGIQCHPADMRSQQDKKEDGSTQKQLEENFDLTRPESLLLKPASCNIQNELSDDIGLASIAPNFLQHDDSMSYQCAQKKTDELVVEQKISFSKEHASVYSPQGKANYSPHGCNTVAAMFTENEEGVTYLTEDKFKSRWLGGWTDKELDVAEKLRQNGGKIFPALFVRETSFLSESADIAPDQYSCVQRCEWKTQVASQSSVSFGHLDEKDDKDWPVSEEVVKCSLSLVDPLCSFVPCSISLDTDCSRQNLKIKMDFTEEYFNTLPEIEVENPEKIPNYKIELQHKPKSASFPKTIESSVDIGGSRLKIRRQSTSLKTYSVVLPTHPASLEWRELDGKHSHQLECNTRPLSPDYHLDGTNFSCKRKFVNPLPFWSSSKARNMDTVEDHHIDANQNLATEITEAKTTSDEVGIEFLVQPVKKVTPGILNQSLQAPKPVTNRTSTEKHHGQSSGPEIVSDPQKIESLMKIQDDSKNPLEPQMLAKERVRFSETKIQQDWNFLKVLRSPKNSFAFRAGKRRKYSNQRLVSRDHEGGNLMSRSCRAGKRSVFQGLEFLLTGFSSRKEKDIEGLVWNYGGVMLPDIPCSSSAGKKMSNSTCKGTPIILSPKKLQTTKFLYGCAVNALIVNISWLTDSIAAGSMLPPWKYMIISNQAACFGIGRSIRHSSRRYIFEKVGFMLQGRQGFCTKLAKVLKHAGGNVFKTLQRLVKNLNKKISVGIIVVEDEHKASRNLKQCALEQDIPIMSGKWVIKCLHLGELLPLTENKHSTSSAKVSNVPAFKDVIVEL